MSISSEFNFELKKQIKIKLNQKLFLWDNESNGILMKYEDLKLLKKSIELVNEQDYLNIPITFNATYFFPKNYENICKNFNEKYKNLNKFRCKNCKN